MKKLIPLEKLAFYIILPIYFILTIGCSIFWYRSCQKETQSKSFIIEHHYVYSNTTYAILYDEYETNSIPTTLVSVTNNVICKIRTAVISVYVVSNGISNLVCSPFKGNSIKTGGFTNASDLYYIQRALATTN